MLASADTRTDSMSAGPSSSRGRGAARGIRMWNSGSLIDVEFDETYHPVVETLERMWKQVKDNLRACPELFRPVCMSKCRKMWKDHKNKVKMQHWKPHQDAHDVLERVPKGILPDQWPQLVRYWTSEEAKKRQLRMRNRTMQGPAHRLGTRHITQVLHELLAEGGPVDRMSVWMRSRDPRHPEIAAIFSCLEVLPEEERSLPSRRDEICHSVVGRDGHGYTLTYGTGIPSSHIMRAGSSGASFSQGLCLRADEEVEELLQSMKAAIREKVTNEVRTHMRAELRVELIELEARLSQSRGPIASDPTPTTQAPDAGSGHRVRHDSVGEGSHDPSGSTDPDQV
ncbi:hypothetical protein AAC387_Pa05g0811 [Persea americana]